MRFLFVLVAVLPALGATQNSAPTVLTSVPEPQLYQLDAGDGVAGAIRIPFAIDRPGVWRWTASWQGRGLAGLWVEDRTSKTKRRVVGASPLVLDLQLADGIQSGEPLLLRFAPLTARGALTGRLELSWPVAEPPADQNEPVVTPPPTAETVLLRGPGRCLEAAFGDDPTGRALRALAEGLELAPPSDIGWVQRWSAQLVTALRENEDETLPRRVFDNLWEALSLDPPPETAAGRGFRTLLAALEDLVRHEGGNRQGGAPPARARRLVVVDTLRCLTPTAP